MNKQIMIDLETMGLSKDAAIVSIGAVRFDPMANDFTDTFYRVVNLKSAQKAGGKVEAETVMWWMGQEDTARLALTGDDGVLIDQALNEFSQWVREEPFEGMWGNGAGFDNVVLEGAYLRAGKTPPWTFKMDLCYRTLRKLFSHVPSCAFLGVKHNALDDAINQAMRLSEIFKLMDSKGIL